MKLECPKCKSCGDSEEQNCLKCGFDFNEFLNANKLADITKVFICPKCGDFDNATSVAGLTCHKCGVPYIVTDINRSEYGAQWNEANSKGKLDEYQRNVLTKYAGDTIDWTSFNKSMESWEEMRQSGLAYEKEKEEKQKLLPKCPTCSSTNIKKISTTAKATNTVLFGLLGNKRKKQFECSNCGYEW